MWKEERKKTLQKYKILLLLSWKDVNIVYTTMMLRRWDEDATFFYLSLISSCQQRIILCLSVLQVMSLHEKEIHEKNAASLKKIIKEHTQSINPHMDRDASDQPTR